jgi:uncharacterized protein
MNLAQLGNRGRLAHPLHTVLLLAVVAVLAYAALVRAPQLKTATDSERMYVYIRTILSEWLILAFVIAGVRFHGSPIRAILGPRWSSVREVLRDIGVGLAFWLVSLFVTSVLGGHGQGHDDNSDLEYLMPHGVGQMLLWIAVSVTAGICEEAIYRGYLQRQLAALARSVPVGIMLSAGAFAGVHLYQGWRRAAVIGLGAVLSGLLAHWRRSVRPSMIAHAWQDAVAPLLIRMIKR